MSADEKLGLVYVPTGNATPDFYGGRRRPFDEAYASAVVAIDALTGEVRWKFQAVHHDLWDYDTPSQPILVDIPAVSGVQHALIQPTKQGETFLLNRETGAPLADVRELPAPQGVLVRGERLSPTQPFSVGMPSFRGPDLREQDMCRRSTMTTGSNAAESDWCTFSSPTDTGSLVRDGAAAATIPRRVGVCVTWHDRRDALSRFARCPSAGMGQECSRTHSRHAGGHHDTERKRVRLITGSHGIKCCPARRRRHR